MVDLEVALLLCPASFNAERASRRPWPRAQAAVQSAAPVPSLVLAAIPHCRSATWPAFARPCPAAWAVGTFHTRLLAKEPQGYFVFPSHHQSPRRARVFLEAAKSG